MPAVHRCTLQVLLGSRLLRMIALCKGLSGTVLQNALHRGHPGTVLQHGPMALSILPTYLRTCLSAHHQNMCRFLNFMHNGSAWLYSQIMMQHWKSEEPKMLRGRSSLVRPAYPHVPAACSTSVPPELADELCFCGRQVAQRYQLHILQSLTFSPASTRRPHPSHVP